MPRLESFARVSYEPKGPAAGAIRLLNEDLRLNGCHPEEVRGRVLNFVKGAGHAHDPLPPAPAFVDDGRGMRLPRPTRGKAKS